MSTFRDELNRDYPHMKDFPIMLIGCPHSKGYCDEADTECGRVGRKNASCKECWAKEIDRPKPTSMEYRDENGQRVTNCTEKWFIHTYTRKPMCVVRVEREDGSVNFETITKDEFYRRWALSDIFKEED